MSEQELKECPFCGSKVYGVGKEWHGSIKLYFVWCWNCGATSGKRGTREEVIKMWNKQDRTKL